VFFLPVIHPLEPVAYSKLGPYAFMYFLYVAIFIFDAVFVFLLWRARQALKANGTLRNA
jgi:hypothetical protein